MNLFLPGMYVAADSPLHRLDPRVKMGAAVVLMTLPFSAHRLASHLLLVAFILALVPLSHVPPLALLRTLRSVFWLGFFMFFFYFFTTPGHPLLAFAGITVTREGLLAGGTQVYRLCLLVVIASLLSFTTSSAQLAHGLEALLGPLERFGFPVREVSFVLTVALRFVPTVMEEVETLTRAQQARGADLGSGGLLRRLRSLVPLFVPLFVAALRRAEELATAMEARGFRSAPHRTRLRRLSLGWGELVAVLILLALALTVLGWERVG